MCNQNVFRLAAFAAIFSLAAASSVAFAAEGGACAVRVTGPQGQSGAVLGHLNAGGKCLTGASSKVAPKAAEKSDEVGSLEASAQCRDLSFSYSKRRDSACSKHGGVLEWLAQQ
ncbi:MAG: DUF3761 domain-containing protein [Dokdonella sp.]